MRKCTFAQKPQLKINSLKKHKHGYLIDTLHSPLKRLVFLMALHYIFYIKVIMQEKLISVAYTLRTY